MISADALLEVEDLKVHFPIGGRGGRKILAVDGVSFVVERGRTLGLVGESGCGKTTIGLAILQLEKPTAGRVVFDGQEVSALGAAEMRVLRRRMQIIFQDAYASLNPRMSIGDSLKEPLIIHGLHKADRGRRVQQLLHLVGLSMRVIHRYPHELSGGQLQRVTIARALARRPGAGHLRRAGIRSRRVDSSPDPQPSQGPAERLEPDLPLHLPRS